MDERQILLKAIEIDSPEQWVAFLDQACGREVGLRENVDALLKTYDADDNFLETP